MSTGVTQRAWQLITNKTAQWLELSRKQGAESADSILFYGTAALGCLPRAWVVWFGGRDNYIAGQLFIIGWWNKKQGRYLIKENRNLFIFVF